MLLRRLCFRSRGRIKTILTWTTVNVKIILLRDRARCRVAECLAGFGRSRPVRVTSMSRLFVNNNNGPKYIIAESPK